MCLSLFVLELLFFFIHYYQFIYYLVQRLGLSCVLSCFRCLTDNAALSISQLKLESTPQRTFISLNTV